MMVKISDTCYISADHIAEVTLNERADIITVRTKDGIGHNMSSEYGKGIYETLIDLIIKINAATKP